MRRRNFISLSLLFLGGSLLGHIATKRQLTTISAGLTEGFTHATENIRLDRLSHNLLLKMLNGQLSDDDRIQLTRELIVPNCHLYIPDNQGRHFGRPGFFRVTP